ncbi:formylglycine-generating enzyme family protein [Oscillatoria sp. FACHB-1407]|nr:formylglycine-generating enzyme family protein [Oscillatoria sp. FACHB-1407]
MQIEPVAEVVSAQSLSGTVEASATISASLDVISQPDLPPPLPPTPTPRANIAAPTPQAGVLPPQVLPVWLADPAMLTDSLAVIRALKPLLQKAEVGTGKRLDEAATVDNIARTRLWLPILEPKQEPWFDIILVVDRGSSMHIWQRLVKDVVRILRRYGAFRDVQVFDLVVQTDQSTGDPVRLLAKPEHPGHRPSELIDQRGRRIAILLSDCAGAYWWDGTMLPMLQEWGKIMPTVVWQMLPAWMWKRTALGRGTAVAISNDIPGVANQRLKTRVQERDEPEDAHQRIPVPVVTSEVRDLTRWSLMVSGDRRQVTPGFLLPQQGGSVPRSKSMEEIAQDRVQKNLSEDAGSDTDPDAAFNEALETIARERVDRFHDLASPQAQRLIMLLAAAPVITLPVVRLIRDAMLYEAQSPLPVAEVFLSGLLLRLPGQEDRELERVLEEERERVQASLEPQDGLSQDESEREPMPLDRQDLVQYDFAPKVRQVLLEVLPAVDTIDVINSVSAAVERRWNRVSDQDFRAFLMNPNAEVPEGLEGLRSFASVTAEILGQLGGEYASFAQQLRQGAGEGVPPDKPDVSGSTFQELEINFLNDRHLELDEEQFLEDFPDLEPFEFVDAQLEDGSISPFPPPLQTEEFTVITVQTQSDLEPFEFTSARLVSQQTEEQTEWIIQRQQGRAYRLVEPLPDEILLEMVSIPAGTFTMGSPDDEPERYDDESPQHDVTVPSFLMGRYSVTQAQWRAVAQLPQVHLELDPDPSNFKGDDRPVEQVSWRDAVEFCERLSVYTKRAYRLPTEAEWEYACRASPVFLAGPSRAGDAVGEGVNTPFHFGDMITTEVANYNGSSYAEGPTGESRGETTPVDYFGIANAFGLSDMHGNVWEWCQDHWHDNYEGAPTDGRAWLSENDNDSRILRCGSWGNIPRYCRSAYRYSLNPDSRLNYIGFRVCCSSPRTL